MCFKDKITWGRFLGTAVAYTALAYVVHTLGAILTMGYYQMPEYFSVWSKIMMPQAGPPPMSFTLYSLLFGLITALIFTYIYILLKDNLGSGTLVQKGLRYGSIVFAIGALSGMLMTILLINLPLGLIVEWAIEMLVINLLGGIMVAKMVK
ncbi:MAG: hypothetical protein WC480_04555 [Patescibacteria group bacterium]